MSGKNLIRKLQCPEVVRKSIKCPGPFFEMIRKLFQKSRYFFDKAMFELLPYQISDHFDHPVKSYGRSKTAKIDLFSKR